MGPQALAIVSPIPDGSARDGDVQFLPRRTGANILTSAAVDRAGAGAALIQSSSNWGLGGTDGGSFVTYQGANACQVRGGIVVHEWRIPLVVTRPAAIRAWRDGLYVIEVILAWPNNAVGADNGLIWGFQDNASNLRPSVAQCFAVSNDTAGGLVFIMRGPTGTQTTALAPGFPLTDFVKVRVELRHATVTTDASCLVFINDSPTPAISKTSADANFPAINAAPSSIINVGVGCGSAVNYVNVIRWGMWRGPDTPLGV